MGNILGGKRSVKIMKISGETLKLKAPVRAGSVMQSHPGHVLLESEAVREYGAQAKPLEPQMELKPSRLYLLIQLSKLPDKRAPRRVRSATHTSAKDRLDSLMLARRSSSDSRAMQQVRVDMEPDDTGVHGGTAGAGVRFRMRLPKAEVERLVSESKDAAEVAEKIVGLCRAAGDGGGDNDQRDNNNRGHNLRQRRVGFLPISEAVPSN